MTNSIQQSPSGKLTGSPASQEILRILWNPKRFIIAFTTARHLSLS